MHNKCKEGFVCNNLFGEGVAIQVPEVLLENTTLLLKKLENTIRNSTQS